MPRKFISPYTPRRRRSGRVVVVWITTFAVLLWLTWYFTSRGKEGAAPEYIRPGRGLRGAPYGGEAAGADAGEGQ